MRSLLLSPSIQLSEKSWAILREVGVEIRRETKGCSLNFSPGVSQVVLRVLQLEKKSPANREAAGEFDQAIESAGKFWGGAAVRLGGRTLDY